MYNDFIMVKDNKLTHVAFIMDGNGRWAKSRGLPRTAGHKAGCDRIIEIYEECLAQGIKAMSLYAFSTENWNRPKAEISQLLRAHPIADFCDPVFWHHFKINRAYDSFTFFKDD